jgi:hypothetical protein
MPVGIGDGDRNTLVAHTSDSHVGEFPHVLASMADRKSSNTVGPTLTESAAVGFCSAGLPRLQLELI